VLSTANTRIIIAALFLAAPLLMAQSTTTPMVSYGAAYRFLEQASWGPDADSIAHVQQVGFSKYIEEQFDAVPSTISTVTPDANGRAALAPMQQEFFANAVGGGDQLRQRLAFALSQIWVVSGVKLTDASQTVPYLRLLSRDAFGNYRTLMYDVTLSPAMGRYLDMVNNDKPNAARGTSANENYARELMQLFTIGLNQLNQDGTLVVNSDGKPIPTYDQETVEEFSILFTGWTYAPQPGTVAKSHNPAYYDEPMVAWAANHDTSPKTLLNGFTIPGGQTAEKDLNDGLDNIFAYQNVAPFLARQLIQHLVTSSPTPSYVERVAGAFDHSDGGRGDMKAVIKAVLLDPEARAGDSGDVANGAGHLREPAVYINGLLRAVGAAVTPANGLPSITSNMGQNVYLPQTVFNYFPPDYEIEGTDLNAPEFGILSPATAMTRADFVNSLVYKKITGVTVNLTPWAQLAATPAQLLDRVNTVLFAGGMPADVRQSIQRAVSAQTSNTTKAQAALYLAATSGLYQVVR
jgi:uncharacterized protein (DUF1800 family)